MSSSPEAAALALLNAGRFAEAETAWRAILARRPDDAQALHLLGLILARTGRAAEGLQLLERSLERAPRNAAFLNNRAQVLAEAGRLEDALRDLRRRLPAPWQPAAPPGSPGRSGGCVPPSPHGRAAPRRSARGPRQRAARARRGGSRAPSVRNRAARGPAQRFGALQPGVAAAR